MPSDFKLCVQFLNPPIPNREFDWGVYMEGEVEEGYQGYGADPITAIEDFLTNAREKNHAISH